MNDPKKTKVMITKENIVILDKVNFETGSAIIEPRSFAVLNQVADVMKKYPRIKKIQIEGHTDDRGADTANQELSANRANAVMFYLTAQGVDAERMTAIGFGETQPIETNATRKGRAANRRVELTVETGESNAREQTLIETLSMPETSASAPPSAAPKPKATAKTTQ